jgi:hypothetical protein
MTLVTLHRQAPVADGATHCQLCGAPISGVLQDHLLVGPPGTAQSRAVACERCGGTIARLVALLGADLHILIREDARAPSQPASESPLDVTRRRLTNQADTLHRTAEELRAEADTLSTVDPKRTP